MVSLRTLAEGEEQRQPGLPDGLCARPGASSAGPALVALIESVSSALARLAPGPAVDRAAAEWDLDWPESAGLRGWGALGPLRPPSGPPDW
jgi:hypothetical protein